jgi:Flp pilus assembly protein TadG
VVCAFAVRFKQSSHLQSQQGHVRWEGIPMTKSQSRNKNRRGTATVELALVLPLFFMVVLGIIEFGRAMMVSNVVTNAAREGARMAVIDGSTNTSVQQAINAMLTQATGVSASSVTTTITVTAAAGNTDPGNQVANAHMRDLISVKVSVPFNSVMLIPGTYLKGKNLIGQSSMRHE